MPETATAAATEKPKPPDASEFKTFTRKNGKTARIRIKPKAPPPAAPKASAPSTPDAKSSGGGAGALVLVVGLLAVAGGATFAVSRIRSRGPA